MQHQAEVHAGKVGGSYWRIPKGINAHTIVVSPTLVSLIEPRTETDFMSPLAAVAAAEPGDVWGLDPHKPGLVSAWAIESEDLKTRVEDANILPPTGRSSGLSPSPSPSSSPSPSTSRSFAGTTWVSKPGGPQKRPLHPLRPPVASTPPLPPPPPKAEEEPPPPVRRPRDVDVLFTPKETAVETEARVRRRIEVEIRKEMEEAAVRKEVVARDNAEARKAQKVVSKVVRDLAELGSREGKAAAEAATDAVAQHERDAEKAVAAAAQEEKAAEGAERRKVAAMTERADGQLKAGHAANKQGDYAKARPAPPPCARLPQLSSRSTLPLCLCHLSPLCHVLWLQSTLATSRPTHQPAPPMWWPLLPRPLAHGCALRHAANRASDPSREREEELWPCAQARHFFLEAHALQNKPAALLSAASMALKLREASTAKREYEQASLHTPRHNLCTFPIHTFPIHRLVPPYPAAPLDAKPRSPQPP